MKWNDQLVTEFSKVAMAGAYGSYAGLPTTAGKLAKFKKIKGIRDEPEELGDVIRSGSREIADGVWAMHTEQQRMNRKLEQIADACGGISEEVYYARVGGRLKAGK